MNNVVLRRLASGNWAKTFREKASERPHLAGILRAGAGQNIADAGGSGNKNYNSLRVAGGSRTAQCGSGTEYSVRRRPLLCTCVLVTRHQSELKYCSNHERQFGLKCAGDRVAFRSAFSEVLGTMRMHSFFSLVQVMKGSERWHTHVANYQ